MGKQNPEWSAEEGAPPLSLRQKTEKQNTAVLFSKREEENKEDIEDKEDEKDPIEWDGSEAKLVLDETASEYEALQTGVHFSWELREEEIYSALKRFPLSKREGKRALAEAVLLAVLAVVFLYQFITGGSSQALFFAAACLLFSGIVLLVPPLGRRNMARRMKKDPRKSHIELSVYPDTIEIGGKNNESEKWEIPLDGSCEMEEYKNMLLLFPAGKNAMVIIPLRSIEPALLPEVQGMLLSGTSKRES